MLFIAVVLALVEGLTEFIPVSSTGHLILASHWLGFTGREAQFFDVVIQLGAILAVVWEYRARLSRTVRGAFVRAEDRELLGKVLVAFLPAAILGVAIHSRLISKLFEPFPVAIALIVGGVVMLIVEALPLRVRTRRLESVTWAQSLGIGLAQCCALWPGFSRSSATIMGGMGAGLDRRTSTEFSFLLAIPIMFGAASYETYKNGTALSPEEISYLFVALAITFVVALYSIRWLLGFVAHHSFRPFAYYRLIVGFTVLGILWWRG